MKKRPAAEWGRECRAALPNEKRYLVGVSGGRDSVALLHWLLARGYRRLVVCHFEHGFRGKAGKADARFAERLAQQHGLPFVLGSADVAAIARVTRRSLETTARYERLAFFQKVGQRRRCLTIFLGHQADDQVETCLLNLFRGAGSRGLGGMRTLARYDRLTLARPLLGVWRSEIDAFVAAEHLKFRDDASNEELVPRRNLLRHRIVPWLEKTFGREVRTTIWRTASVLAEEDDFLESLLPAGLTNAKEISLDGLHALAPALQRRALRQWLRHGEVAEVNFELLAGLQRLLTGDDPATVNLARDRHARRRGGRIVLE